ncbi:hypothetical protein HNP93_001356 [Methanococcus maripaludis]|uniref:TIR domain-containing protein n=1 Tax=Methanococcus maripaludis TaxID=39152 RepID=A0A7J9P617_METMI|nr:toll/interleukin-1 receptor domain-containing protein [Methanococcus maripaludis]MBA2858655.1 hypothetical protein [Methanococcus maripaludis]
MVNSKIRPLFTNLLRLNLEDYLKSKMFRLFLVERDLNAFWISSKAFASMDTGSVGLNYEEYALGRLLDEYSKSKSNFIKFIGEFLSEFIKFKDEPVNVEPVIMSLNVMGTDIDLGNRISKVKMELNDLNQKYIKKDTETPKIVSGAPINIPAVPKPTSKSVQNTIKKIFISHSSKDKEYARLLKDILESAGLSHDQIFCTSLPGHGIGLGKDFLEDIKNKLNDDYLVLFLISKNFYESSVCMCELGATWVLTKDSIPVLIPPFDYNDMDITINRKQGFKINEKTKIHEFKEHLDSNFNKNVPVAVWNDKVEKILSEINQLLDEDIKKLKESEKENSSVSEEKKAVKIEKKYIDAADSMVKKYCNDTFYDPIISFDYMPAEVKLVIEKIAESRCEKLPKDFKDLLDPYKKQY